MSVQNRFWKQLWQQAARIWNVLYTALGLQRLHYLVNFYFVLTLLLLLAIGLAGILWYIDGHYQQQQTQLAQQQLAARADAEITRLNAQIEQAQGSVRRLRGYVSIFEQNQPVSQADLAHLKDRMTQDLSLHPQQFSQYYAFESQPAQSYFGEEAMLGVLYKNLRRVKTPNYNDPDSMRFKTWRDLHYLKNEREIWYHINKTNQEVHFTPVYFDKNYTQAEVFSITQGIYNNKQFQGIVGVNILSDSFFAPIETQKIGETGGFFLVDYTEGLQLSRNGFTEEEQYAQASLLEPHNRMSYNLYRGNNKQVEQWKKLLVTTTNGAILVGVDGQQYLVYTRLLESQPWTLVLYQALNEAQSSEQSSYIYFWSLTLLFLMLLVGWLLFYHFAKPLQQILQALHELSRNPELQLPDILAIPGNGSYELQKLNTQLLQVLNSQTHQLQRGIAEVLEYQQNLTECEERETGLATSLAEQTRRLNHAELENEKFKAFVRKAKAQLQQLKVQGQRFKAHAQKAELDAQQARMEANHAGQAKAQFLANMSHELRTPMNAIIGYTEILQEDAEDLGHFDFIPDLQKIHGASYHLLDLINNLFDLSRIESSQMDLYLENFDITPMLQDVANTVQPLIEKQDNILKLELQGALGTMNADMTKVRQNLLNLLSNASKFSKQSIITLFSTRQRRDGIDWIIFKVSDEGIGISPEQMNKLFQAFTRMDESAPSGGMFGGSGVGLALTKQFCQIMGGDIAVESELGKGSIFTITLPADVSAMIHV